MTLYDSVNNVLKRLDDYPVANGEQVWTRAEVELYLEDGYNAFCRQTKCLFDLFYPENIPPVGNYTARWELGYYESGMIAYGILSYSGGYWERDYAQASGTGPINHTQPWEAEYIETTFAAAVHAVPEDNVAVDRATHDLHQLKPEFTKFFEENDRSFQTVTGEPWRFSMDRDGVSRLRIVPAGTGNATQTDGVLFPNVLAYWPLVEPSGDRNDLAGTHLLSNGTHALTDATGISSTSGVVDQAALFMRVNSDYMSTESVDISSGGVSVCFWVKLTTKSNYQGLVQIGMGPGQPGLIVYSGATGQIIAEAIEDDVPTYVSVTINSALSDVSVWHFVCVSFDPSDGKVHAHHNSTVYGPQNEVSVSSITNIPSGSYPVYVGWAPGTSYYLDGAMSGVMVYSGVLTAAELLWLYNSGAGRPFPYVYDGTFRDSTHRKAGNYGYGLLRQSDATEFGIWSPIGTWGGLREIPQYYPMGAQYGIPRRLYSDTANTRAEYFRLGKDWEENGSELPSRFLKYAEFYAQSKCLEREGPGQDLKLAGHFMERFSAGVRRMVKRLGENKRAVSGKIGSPGRMPTVPALARLPWRYGRQIRRGY